MYALPGTGEVILALHLAFKDFCLEWSVLGALRPPPLDMGEPGVALRWPQWAYRSLCALGGILEEFRDMPVCECVCERECVCVS